MGLVLRCFVVLSLCTFAAGSDFLQDPRPAGRSRFERSSNIAEVVKRSLPEWLAPTSPKHIIQRRSADSCDALQDYGAKLDANTHTYTLQDLSGSVSLAWVGDGSGVILALTTFQVPFFMIRFGQSKLYRSEDYGKSFQDVTELINNTFIRSEFGIAISPDNSGKVILTAEVSDTRRTRIFVSNDFGKSFSHHELPFSPLMQISYNPEDCNVLVARSNNELWLSRDFGKTWNKIHDMVCLHISYKTQHGKKPTQTFTNTVKTKIYSFGLGGRFLFASVMTGKDMMRMIQVSVDQGDSWNMAQLPSVGHEQFYSILAASDDMVFMHVDESGDSGFGTIYVSDDRGTVYSKSLERHLYTTTGGDTDFTNVTSLRGVFITSILAEDNSVKSVVSFDQGGEWVPLQKPANSMCDATSKDPDKCSLHLHAAYSVAERLNVPMLPLSEPNAVGLILSHGSVGDAISVMKPDVYVSDDGGYSWIKALDGPHHYAILDSGGLLVAVEHKPNEFSTDEGQCWHEYNFTKEPIYFTGLASEPGARSMNVSLWGYQDSFLSQFWVSFTIDFRELLTRDCTDTDYVQWLAHSDDISDPNDGCILGYKEKFLRLRKDSVCWNGRDYLINKQPSPCPCTLDDFLCDFGYFRQENSSECVEQDDLKGKVLEFCLYGKEEQLQTKGYRKIPGDKCEGGKMPERLEIDLRQHCVSDLVSTSSKSMPAVITFIVIIMLSSVVAGVFFVKKYVCGGRFLVHRYSVLQQHAAENGDLDEPLETNHTRNGKIVFHDDSDEVYTHDYLFNIA
uniref:Sortilin 1b n=1 Tax=Neogobius melanostomus TaxID=47308 RepID=A0A8C6TN51_9GOBI